MEKSKKTIKYLPILLIFLILSINAEASFSVPAEIKIRTDNNLHASKEITIINHNSEIINISCFLEKTHKNYLKENRTRLPDSTWVKINPKWQKIQPNKGAVFEITVDIPADEENFNQKWQVWLTFHSGEGSFSVEHSSNLLIDTTIYNPDLVTDSEIIEIDMKNGFIHGNTTKKISITNNFEKEINIETIIRNPTIFTKKNYSNIPNLSWISTNPSDAYIKPGETKNFFIYIDPEEKQEYTKKFWETIIIFKACYIDDPNNCVELNPRARIILKTPDELTGSIEDDDKIKGVSTDPLGVLPNGSLVLILVLFFLVFALFLFYRKKIKK